MFKKKAAGRHTYHKSPGRQYNAEFGPQNGQHDPQTWQDDEIKQPGGSLSPRPDPRRTRQIMRQHIIADKARSTVLDPAQESAQGEQGFGANHLRSGHDPRAPRPSQPGRNYPTRRYQPIEDEEQIVNDWLQHGEGLDNDAPDYYDDVEESDPLAARVRQAPRLAANPLQTRRLDPETEDELLEEELEEKRKKAARRKFLLGAVAVGGTAVAAYELVPRIPGAIGNGAANIEHQLQQAFQQGVTQGADAARKDLLNSLDTIEGFSLNGAIEAAKLTRVAYDVFVSPLVTLAATVAGDFLTVTLNALIAGRNWLRQINEDSPTLAALQVVLQSWVNQVQQMPKEVQNITDSDLDGAQSYLRALQRKIQQEQAQLNNPNTPTPGGNATPGTVITPPGTKH